MTVINKSIVISVCCAILSAGCKSDGLHKSENQSAREFKNGNQSVSQDEDRSYLKDISALAAKVDTRLEDGWICRRNSRVLKSKYRFVSPGEKAKFAIAYNKMLVQNNQNLAMSINSYVPYSKRIEFALNWWRNSNDKEKFASENTKKKVVWLHESLLDASELYWRVFEERNQSIINNATVMAHDREQDMVFNYTEVEGKPGSYSKLYAKWADKLNKLD